MRYVILAIFGLFLGIGSGYFVMSETAPGPVRKTFHKENSMEIMGFQPFWLLNEADPNYIEYTSTLTYFGLQLNDNGTIRKLNNKVEQEPGWANLQTNRLKKLLVSTKESGVTLSIAVQNADEESISFMMEDPKTSAINLIEDIEPIMEQYGFTDLNLDIESFIDVTPDIQDSFTVFVQTVRKEMIARELGTLSIDITPMALIRPRLTSVPDIEEYVDRVVLMAYDYTYSGSAVSGPVAPLGGAGEVREYDVESALGVLLQQTDADKILLGIPSYGYEWETLLATPNAPVIPGTGKTASAKRVERLLRNCGECVKGREEFSQQPYLIQKEGDYYRQYYYADDISIRAKLELAKKYSIKGVALWAYGYETSSMKDELSIFR